MHLNCRDSIEIGSIRGDHLKVVNQFRSIDLKRRITRYRSRNVNIDLCRTVPVDAIDVETVRDRKHRQEKHAIGRAFGDKFQRRDDMNDKHLSCFGKLG